MMRLSPAAFNRHLEHMGQDFLYRKSFICPCRDPHSGAARVDCPKCRGKGVFWGAPITGKAGVASQAVVKKYAQHGLWETGDAVFSIPENSTMYNAGRFDRMIMLNSTDNFSLTLVRGDGDVVDLPVEKFDPVYWLLPDGETIMTGGVPTVDSTTGELSWSSGAPPIGTQYSVTGTRFTEYFVWENLPSDRGEHHGARLPKRLQARRFDLFGR